MKRIRIGNTRRNRILSNRTNSIASVLTTLVGLALSAPFVIDIFVFKNGYAHITMSPFLEIMGIVIGGPLFLIGLVSFGDVSSRGVSTQDVDVARIRFAAEQEMLRKK